MKQDELNKGKNLKSLISEYFIFVIFIIIVIGLTILKPSFITPSNLVNILKQASINGILAFGMLFVIISGGFDMSVGRRRSHQRCRRRRRRTAALHHDPGHNDRGPRTCPAGL